MFATLDILVQIYISSYPGYYCIEAVDLTQPLRRVITQP